MYIVRYNIIVTGPDKRRMTAWLLECDVWRTGVLYNIILLLQAH